jgi:hypothetical protein
LGDFFFQKNKNKNKNENGNILNNIPNFFLEKSPNLEEKKGEFF